MINSAPRKFGDLEAFQKFVRGGDARVLVSGRGEYQGELARVDLPHVWMQRFWQSLPTLTHIKVDETRSTIVFSPMPGNSHQLIRVSKSVHVVSQRLAWRHGQNGLASPRQPAARSI